MVMGPSQLAAHTLSYFVLPKCKKWAASSVGEQQSKVWHLETLGSQNFQAVWQDKSPRGRAGGETGESKPQW